MGVTPTTPLKRSANTVRDIPDSIARAFNVQGVSNEACMVESAFAMRSSASADNQPVGRRTSELTYSLSAKISIILFK